MLKRIIIAGAATAVAMIGTAGVAFASTPAAGAQGHPSVSGAGGGEAMTADPADEFFDDYLAPLLSFFI
jgi:hypothetical protein